MIEDLWIMNEIFGLETRDAMEQDGTKGKGLHLRPTWFWLAPSLPHPIRWRKFSYPIPTPRDPAKPCPTL